MQVTIHHQGYSDAAVEVCNQSKCDYDQFVPSMGED